MEKLDFILQREICLPEKSRGLHLITSVLEDELPELRKVKSGILHVFVKHTSASLSINENADPAVRRDLNNFLDRLIPEGDPYFEHTAEGPDDMPAHIKAAFMGTSVQVPVLEGKLDLGTWQGIYFGEHRNRGGNRRLVLSLIGSKA